jgi:hypothetical protein
MSAKRSPAVEMAYGAERVCMACEQPRSTYYAQVLRTSAPVVASSPKQKRGLKTDLSDDDLLGAIQQTINDSLFDGEAIARCGLA